MVISNLLQFDYCPFVTTDTQFTSLHIIVATSALLDDPSTFAIGKMRKWNMGGNECLVETSSVGYKEIESLTTGSFLSKDYGIPVFSATII